MGDLISGSLRHSASATPMAHGYNRTMLSDRIPTNDYTEHEVDATRPYEGRLIKLRRDTVRLPDGAATAREYVDHPGAVMMMPFLDANTIILERQYRYPLRAHYIELPAGKRELDEPALDTAKRELIEEVGYAAARWDHLCSLHPCIGYSTEIIELYAARELTHVGQQLDQGEFLDVFTCTLQQAVAWVKDGTICDTKTQLGILWVAQFGLPA